MDWLNQLHQAGVKVVLDSSNAALTAGLKAHPWLVKPNHRELEAWIGHPLNSLDEIGCCGKTSKPKALLTSSFRWGASGLRLSDQVVIQAQPAKCENVVSNRRRRRFYGSWLNLWYRKGLSQAGNLSVCEVLFLPLRFHKVMWA